MREVMEPAANIAMRFSGSTNISKLIRKAGAMKLTEIANATNVKNSCAPASHRATLNESSPYRKHLERT